jgi:dolichol kinase
MVVPLIMSSVIREDRVSSLAAATNSATVICIPRSPPVRPAALDDIASLQHWLTSRMPAQEWRRRVIHMAPGILPGLMLAIPHPHPLPWYSLAIIAAVVLGMSAFALRNARLFERPNEAGWSTSVISYGVITLALLLAFPAQPEIGLAVTVIIALGDGAATLGGLLIQGPRLPWNHGKSWAGLSTFLLLSVPVAGIVYWAEARPGVSMTMALACVGPAALAAAVAETLPLRLNDNIRVGVSAGLTIIMTQAVLGR